MTVMAQPLTGASSTLAQQWDSINWKTTEAGVNRLQMRIAKAIRENKHGKAKAFSNSKFGLIFSIIKT